MNTVHRPSSLNKLAWKIRPLLFRHPLSHDIKRWRLSLDEDHLDSTVVERAIARVHSWWLFLTPFFAAHGYILYTNHPNGGTGMFWPHPYDGRPTSRQTHPFARRLYAANKDASFSEKPCIRGARDRYGRDVVIRIVSGPKRSAEFDVLKRLTSTKALQDPRNITIPVLDWLEFDGLVFIVMPRWEEAFYHDFGTVAEHLSIADNLLAYLEFLHEQKISHMDIHPGNIAINTTAPSSYYNLRGLREPTVTRYAVFDFGCSFIYPYDTSLDAAQETWPAYNWGLHGLRDEDGYFNPFHADVGALGAVFDEYLKVIYETVPSIIPFIESMTTLNPSDRPTAHEAYLNFKALRSSLTMEQLNAPLLYYRFDIHNNNFRKKPKRITYPDLPDPRWSP